MLYTQIELLVDVAQKVRSQVVIAVRENVNNGAERQVTSVKHPFILLK